MIKRTIILSLIFLIINIQSTAQMNSLEDLKRKYPQMTEFTEQSINLLGYRLMRAGNLYPAIKVLSLNTRLFPQSWNAFDSLGEVFMKAGKRERAIESFRRSLQLNPKNVHGERLLQRLLHPQLAPFTGQFEYYQDFRYHRLTLYIKDGTLMMDEPRHPHIAMMPVEGKQGLYTGTREKKPCRFIFSTEEDGSVNQFQWVQEEITRLVNRHPANILKETYAVEELAADFKQFRHLVEKMPGHTYRFITRQTFNQLFDRQARSINRPLTLQEFYTLLLPLKAAIGCGHCHLDYPGQYRSSVQVHKFPLILTFLNNRCYVVKNLQPKIRIEPFQEIIALNGIKMDQIIDRLKEDISADGYNDHWRTSALASCFQYYYANRYGAPKEFSIDFKNLTNQESQRVVVPALPCRGINYSNRPPSRLGFTINAQMNTAIMRVDSFIYYGKRDKIFFDYIDKAFKKIIQEKPKNLIIDLRGNSGGNPFCASHLLSYIEKKPTVYFSQPYGRYARLARPVPQAENHFTGPIYMLIDGSNFSTSGHFLALVKYHKLATLVGSETGGTFTCNGAVRGFHLKNTRILVKLSIKSYAAAVQGFTANRGIIPDHTVCPNLEDIRKGKDTVLEYTLGMIKRSQKK